MDAVEAFWTQHTVRDEPFTSPEESLAWLDWRSAEYPLFHDLMGLWGDHAGETVLDFGCGPANDLVGFLVHGHAERAIGVDISATARALAERRLRLHGIDPARYSLRRSTEGLLDGSVDYIYSQGVLHHTRDPQAILAELARVLRPGGTAAIMVYNRDSLFFHLYVAYHLQVLGGAFPGQPVEEAFRHSSDGPGCPVSVPYRSSDFLGMCRAAGFTAEYAGGYFARLELDLWYLSGARAMRDERLADEHRRFLRSLDPGAYPTRDSLPAGIGGVYRLRR